LAQDAESGTPIRAMSLDAPTTPLPGTAPYAPGWERTEVARPVAVALSVLFAAGLVSVPLLDGWLGAWRGPWRAAVSGVAGVAHAFGKNEPWMTRLLEANRAAKAGIGEFESSLEDSSQLVEAVRPATLDALLRFGGAGSEKAYVGRDGWLFYRPDVDALALGRRADAGNPAEGLAVWAADLAERGVRLVFLPLPGKAAIHPEELAVRGGVFAAPLVPRGLENLSADVVAAWEKEARKRSLDTTPALVVLDPAPLLWARKAVGAQFLRTDSHWTPDAMAAVANETATTVAGMLGLPLPAVAVDRQEEIRGFGDTAAMMELPAASPFREEQSVIVTPVRRADGSAWQPDRSSPVLVVGDSYTNIYSSADLGWGASAGFAEQLSRRLGFDVDRLSRNDAGARSAREMVMTEAAKNPDWLAGKKVIVWPLAMREVAAGDWSAVHWPEARAVEEFLVVGPGETKDITATVAALGPLPRQGDTPYADYLTAVHLTDIDGTGAQAVVYVRTMQDRQLLPAEALRPGTRVRARLVGYEERAEELDSLNRGELEDVALLVETPNFAEWISPADR
jgi:alginate O-acetyltransferase complex protein AlgJ